MCVCVCGGVWFAQCRLFLKNNYSFFLGRGGNESFLEMAFPCSFFLLIFSCSVGARLCSRSAGFHHAGAHMGGEPALGECVIYMYV